MPKKGLQSLQVSQARLVATGSRLLDFQLKALVQILPGMLTQCVLSAWNSFRGMRTNFDETKGRDETRPPSPKTPPGHPDATAQSPPTPQQERGHGSCSTAQPAVNVNRKNKHTISARHPNKKRVQNVQEKHPAK